MLAARFPPARHQLSQVVPLKRVRRGIGTSDFFTCDNTVRRTAGWDLLGPMFRREGKLGGRSGVSVS